MGITDLKRLQEEAKANPDDAEAWYRLGKYTVSRYIVSISERALARAAELSPADPRILTELGKALNRKRHLSEAEKVYRRALELNPNDPSLWTGLAVVMGHQLDTSSALAYYEKALEIDAGYPWAVANYVDLCHQLSRTVDLEAVLAKAIEARPDASLNWAIKFSFLKKIGRTNEARDAYYRAIELIETADPDDIRRISGRLHGGPEQESLDRKLEKIVEGDPTNIGVYLLVMRSYLSKQDIAGATSLIETGLEIDPDNQLLSNMYFIVLMQSGRVREANELKERTKKLRPEDPLLKVTEALYGDITGVSDQTIEEHRKLLATMPKAIVLRVKLVQRLAAAGRFDEAQDVFRAGLELDYDSVKEYLHCAAEAMNMGLHEEADKLIQKGLRLEAISPMKTIALLATRLVYRNAYSELEDKLRALLSEHEEMRPWYSVLGRLEMMKGDREAANHCFLIGAEYDVPDSMLAYASVLKRQGQGEKADKMLERVFSLEYESESKEAEYKSRVEMARGKFTDARERLDLELKERPANLAGWTLLLALTKRLGTKDDIEMIVRRFASLGKEEGAIDQLVEEVMASDWPGQSIQETYLRSTIEYLTSEFLE